MHAWRDDVARFARAVRGKDALDESRGACMHYPLATALDIYRNNLRGNLQGALAVAYPVTERIVGTDFFRLMARAYIDDHPSASGNLHHYGEQFAPFIANFAHARTLGYLADVAALEWACHLAYYAEDAGTIDLEKLARVPVQLHEQVRLLLHPTCHLVRSPYPVAAIWHAHQPGAPDEFRIDLDQGPCNALVTRVDDEVQVRELPDADADWVQRLQQGLPLGKASAATLALYHVFDLPAALLGLVKHGTIAGFVLPEEEESP
ncbi:MAG: DNA-binding domain-containing protein [Pseudomonadota bacterium]